MRLTWGCEKNIYWAQSKRLFIKIFFPIIIIIIIIIYMNIVPPQNSSCATT